MEVALNPESHGYHIAAKGIQRKRQATTRAAHEIPYSAARCFNNP
ncbi:hypothetical protein KAM448_29210 [Aeromonas caviae]|nr:hypothetical protein KAM362_35250 [Aeromonas caviae]GKQ80627.1 hypothetical protein KAM448_29210 [Aeromonas caviae]